ncbi:hypothetical protein Ddye_028604 [Dipteronia dyeriana]|uniref:Uncharacterized protein n=1 Tax=Dipteronia dyeriana TaxID=168575 RepID=A0AAD9WKP1_9ROSI|nr:hypothetical protein Ddye_028604 [Dipteronia dyeriana]
MTKTSKNQRYLCGTWDNCRRRDGAASDSETVLLEAMRGDKEVVTTLRLLLRSETALRFGDDELRLATTPSSELRRRERLLVLLGHELGICQFGN